MPGIRNGALKEPSASVVWVLDVPWPWLAMVTPAPGTAAPCWSLTVPTMVPVVTCACAVVAPTSPATAIAIRRASFLMHGLASSVLRRPIPATAPARASQGH